MSQAFPAQMSVGLVPMSAKPLQRGHFALIERAARECDHVIVYVSMGDRKRPGEFPILGTDMMKIWRTYVEPMLPDNVVIRYVTAPIRDVFAQIGDESQRSMHVDVATYLIYSGEDDATANFPQRSIAKYAGHLFENGKVMIVPVERTPYSGTQMRHYLQMGDEKKFKADLPDVLDDHAKSAIWNILVGRSRNV